MARLKGVNLYTRLIEEIFLARYQAGDQRVTFGRDELVTVANSLGVALPKNLGDVIYSFRYRAALPESIRRTAPEGQAWVIRPAGRAQYQFALIHDVPIRPSSHMAETKIPDATPGTSYCCIRETMSRRSLPESATIG